VPTDYVRVFDAAVDDAVAHIRPGPLVVLLSGGLDSTFLAASLARHATSDHPVIGLVHRPVAQAPERPAGNAVHDEWEYAQRLAASSSGRIELEPITNDDAQCSLDVALANARRGWLPTRNPANSVWTTAARARAVDLGANRLFNGGTGNFSYSNPHSYAPGYLLRRGRVRPFTRLVSARAQTAGWRRAVRSTLGQLTYDLRHRDDGTRDYVSLFDMDPELVGCSRPRSTYPAFLEAMADLGISNMGAVNPARVEGVLAVDPFEAPSVLQFAAEITPAEWVRHGTQRGFARAAAAGRVPDAIRLRRSRGGQSMDSWWAARQHRGTYLAQAAATADTPVVRDIVDCAALLRRVTAWPWDSPVGPTPVELVAVERLLHTSAYLRWVQEAAKGR
jgi:asparagine synthetase B (glutamine-hydrolysing)